FGLRLLARRRAPCVVAAAAVVARRLLATLLLCADRVEPLGRAPALVRIPLREQPLRGRAIAVEPLRLDVRPIRSADLRPFVPAHAEPAQALEDAFDGARLQP